MESTEWAAQKSFARMAYLLRYKPTGRYQYMDSRGKIPLQFHGEVSLFGKSHCRIRISLVWSLCRYSVLGRVGNMNIDIYLRTNILYLPMRNDIPFLQHSRRIKNIWTAYLFIKILQNLYPAWNNVIYNYIFFIYCHIRP